MFETEIIWAAPVQPSGGGSGGMWVMVGILMLVAVAGIVVFKVFTGPLAKELLGSSSVDSDEDGKNVDVEDPLMFLNQEGREFLMTMQFAASIFPELQERDNELTSKNPDER